jgi:short-subunit dehydrogenase
MGSALRAIREQVVVITGASSGIGRETALQFASRGASVLPIARSREGLESLKQEIERMGGMAHPLVADVSEWQHVKEAADEAVDRFGRIDTWVNNAAVSLYANVEDAGVEEIRRVVDVILMGQIHGMKAALPHLKRQGRGAIINVASALAKRSVPLQAAYCAAKHGVKGFTESLRLELEHEKSGVSVTLILPSSVNTPLFEHARSYMGVEPKPLPPVYEARAVAEAILFAAEHPRREITVGGAGKLLDLLERASPQAADSYMLRRSKAFKGQQTKRPDDRRDNLFQPIEGIARVTGEFGSKSKSVSAYTRNLEYYPGRQRILTGALAASTLALVPVVGAGVASRRAGRHEHVAGRREGQSRGAAVREGDLIDGAR